MTSIQEERLADFLESHDLHLLTDATDIVSVGTIYRNFGDSKSRRIGYASNFLIPEVTLPDTKKGTINNIRENLRDKKSVNFIVSGISKFISSFGFAVNTSNEKVVETSYSDVKLEEIDNVTMWNLIKDHHFDTSNTEYDTNSEYYIVTKVVKSKDFKVNMKLSKDLKAVLQASGGQPIIDGNVKLEYAKGKLDEVTWSHSGSEPLVFGVHLENIEFDKTSGTVKRLVPLTKVTKLLATDENFRLLEVAEGGTTTK